MPYGRTQRNKQQHGGETDENIRLSERKAATDHGGDVCETLY